MKRSVIIILAVVALLFAWGISLRNSLATAETGINGKWGMVQTQYNRKAKLYENIVNTIKGAATNEDTTLIKIVQMRSRVPEIAPNASPEQIAEADKQLNQIGRAALNINIEAYPTLKSTELFQNLQTQIEGTENRVTTALNDWNQAITDYNMKVVRFPGNIIAGMMGYKQKQNYVAPAGAEDTKIDFSK